MKSVTSTIILFLFSGVAWSYTPISDGELAAIVAGFNYQPQVQILKLPQVSCKAQDMEYTTTYPQRDTPLNINAKAFIPAGSQIPVVFMLPPLGGMNQMDEKMGEAFCNANIAAILITTTLTGLDSPTLVPVTDHDHTHRRVASAIKGGMLAIRSLPQLNTLKIGLFGVSLGGILGSVAYGVIPEISAATLLVNGGDVPFILAYSDQSSIIKLRTARMAEQGFKTFEQYETYLRQHLTIDPLHFAKLIDPNTVKLFLSKTDKSVPSVKQMEYYDALGAPKETSFYSLSHINTIFSVMGLGPAKQKIIQWFQGRFYIPNPRIENLQ
ncbi:MAG: hypothetical protein ABL930_01575 [Pseudobdellovibrio sp.]